MTEAPSPEHVLLARGPFGTTWRCGDRLIKEAAPGSEAFWPWGIPREIEVYTSGLRHPSVPTLIDAEVGEGATLSRMVLEFVPGATVRQRLIGQNPLDGRELLETGASVASALDALHDRGFVHRDVHIHNVVVREGSRGHEQARGAAVLIDCGIAGVLRDGQTVDRKLKTGSPRYAAPEQLVGGPQTAATDVWGLGAMLFCIAYRRAPYADGGPRQRPPKFGPLAVSLEGGSGAGQALDELIRETLRLKPERRPSLTEVRERLQGLLQPYRG